MHNKCNALESFQNYPPTPSVGKLSSMKMVLGTRKFGNNCFTMLHQFLSVQWSESAICTHISLFSWTFLPPLPHPTHLGHYKAPSWASYTIQQLLTSYLYFTCGSSKECTCNAGMSHRKWGFDPWVLRIPCKRALQSTPVSLLE